jgi:hypothetical protein
MDIWNRLTARFGPQPDLLGFASTATPTADAWLQAFTDHFMSHPNAAAGADAFMSGVRFYTAAFVAEIKALPPVEERQPPLPGRIPRAIYMTAGPIIVDVYQNLMSRNAGHREIHAAFVRAMPGLLRQNNYILH